MKVVLLGGNHKLNKEWVDEIAQSVGDLFEQAVVQNFYHWSQEHGMIDLDKEADQLEKIVEGWDEYIVFAKSAGTLVTLKCLHEGRISPGKLIFVGLPYEWGKEKGWDVDAYLKSLKIKTLFIQKPHDWAMAYSALETLLTEKVGANYETLEYKREGEPDDDHHYADIAYLKSLIQEYINEG